MRKHAMTVMGKLEADQLGITYEHEHVFTYLLDKEGRKTYSVTDITATEKELTLYKNAGGKTIVDVTGIGMGREAGLCKALSFQTGLNIICATGFYRDACISDQIKSKTDTEIERILMNEVENGVDFSDIRPGILKMAVSLNEITPMEKRIAGIMARVQQRTGMPLYCHLTNGTMGMEAASLLLSEGADPGQVLIGHIDVTKDYGTISSLCKLGVNVSLDKFGREVETKDLNRVNIVKRLIEDGFVEQVFISSDMGNPVYLKYYGGTPGLDYLMVTVVPCMLENGITEGQINQMLIDNPRRAFCFLP